VKKQFPLLAVSLLIAGCASNPWPHYESAIRCHLDQKTEECNKEYEAAIKLDPKLQGVHASYGTHLLKLGKTVEAQKEFDLEKANYPTYAEKGLAALHPSGRDATSTTTDTTKH
jgi:hypothetical protein